MFTRMLAGLDAHTLKATIPDFHNLTLRYAQFQKAIRDGNEQRKKESAEAIAYLLSCEDIVNQFGKILTDPAFAVRVIHHDTKISNVLFDANNKGICVIDLDTTMPGYFISDLGDMFQTYLWPVGEEETDFSQIRIREDFFSAIVKGYLSEMGSILSENEKAAIIYSGKFMIYMQALRFLADYLNNDIYYGSKHKGHFHASKKSDCFIAAIVEGRTGSAIVHPHLIPYFFFRSFILIIEVSPGNNGRL
jgi:Ser/Thr protein kinase RdoA (MazF antagonist)